jgi:DNA-binding GntR family transcriptional regulator
MQTTLAEKAYTHIRGMLSRGELAPGTRLVNRALAAEIGISFTPVREAINQLASEGLVEYVRGAGAYVRRVDRVELEQLFDLRANLEPFATSQAAQHIDSAQLEELFRLCEHFHDLARGLRDVPRRVADVDTWAEWLDVEESFHGLLFRAAGNVWLTKVAAELRLMAMLFGPQRTTTGILTFSSAARSWREHTVLARLLAGGDAAAAEVWMRRHVATGRRNVLARYDARGPA